MFNIIVGCFCILVAIFFINIDLDKNAKFILFTTIMGAINLSIGVFLCLDKDTYIVTITQKDGTAIEFKTKDYDIEDTYIKVKQDDGYLYIYEIKDVKVKKEDK